MFVMRAGKTYQKIINRSNNWQERIIDDQDRRIQKSMGGSSDTKSALNMAPVTKASTRNAEAWRRGKYTTQSKEIDALY